MGKERGFTYPEAPATGSLAMRAGRATEGGPAVLAAPGERIVGVPGGTVHTGSEIIPPNILWVIQMVGCPHVGSALGSCSYRQA